jgi:polysaccharide export outer membrane protein
MNRFVSNLTVIFLFTIVLFSCAAPQKSIYFRTDTKMEPNVESMPITASSELNGIIQPDDIIAINITSISSIAENKDPAAIFRDGGIMYNLVTGGGGMGGGGGGGGMGTQTSGYLVDNEGFIDFPVLGKINVRGQTIRQAKETISGKLKDYIKDPVVEVRIINYKVTMLGEINRPGPIIAANHKINIVEAVAAAGDIPLTGKKENVLVIRDNNGKKEFARLNLNSRDVFNSPYYYLKQNDIVYIEPNKIRRQEANTFFRVYLPIFTTLLSTALAVYGIVQIANNNK